MFESLFAGLPAEICGEILINLSFADIVHLLQCNRKTYSLIVDGCNYTWFRKFKHQFAFDELHVGGFSQGLSIFFATMLNDKPLNTAFVFDAEKIALTSFGEQCTIVECAGLKYEFMPLDTQDTPCFYDPLRTWLLRCVEGYSYSPHRPITLDKAEGKKQLLKHLNFVQLCQKARCCRRSHWCRAEKDVVYCEEKNYFKKYRKKYAAERLPFEMFKLSSMDWVDQDLEDEMGRILQELREVEGKLHMKKVLP